MKTRKLNKTELAELLAKAMNLLNDVNRDEWTNRQLGDFHELANAMPECCDYANNGTVLANELC